VPQHTYEYKEDPVKGFGRAVGRFTTGMVEAIGILGGWNRGRRRR
jgi:hypothetical protein